MTRNSLMKKRERRASQDLSTNCCGVRGSWGEKLPCI